MHLFLLNLQVYYNYVNIPIINENGINAVLRIKWIQIL